MFLIGERNILTVWVTDLVTGTPINEANVMINNQVAKTNKGLCHIEQKDMSDGDAEMAVLTVEKDGDMCIINSIYKDSYAQDKYVWEVFNDRGLYRPKETVYIKGYVRLLKAVNDARVPTYVEGVVEYKVHDSRSNLIAESQVHLNDYGAFDINFTLPDNMNLGKS